MDIPILSFYFKVDISDNKYKINNENDSTISQI